MTARQRITTTLDRANTMEIPLARLKSSSQPLRNDDEELLELKNSISIHGLFHPLLVKKSDGDSFEVISGNRRLQALRQSGARNVPCRILDVDNKEAFEISIAENLDRRSLDPVEEALAFRHYISIRKWGRSSTLARKIGKSEEYVSHRLKLLNLPSDILPKIGKEISPSHAEELTWLQNADSIRKLARITIESKLTVRQLHELANKEKETSIVKHPRLGCSGEIGASIFQSEQLDESRSSEMIRSHKPPDVDRILRLSTVSLRYVLTYIDSCLDKINSACDDFEESFAKFLLDERYQIHEILDHFVSAQVKRRRAKDLFPPSQSKPNQRQFG